ncbi:site-specific integrase [Fredinandcohnia sp. QZ13]|uniref:tyrosine-type recombinase/integrase n=1 Tax=Fredinandcohnia sp. QZ13 TaxID=3073144 RepID=UPI002852F9C5|nr:site-specific integrase [Fredinandcohnia sp. QZ13]MDR4886318.1 site-specific integrase [Fredinandcohnia sp. QZ13]
MTNRKSEKNNQSYETGLNNEEDTKDSFPQNASFAEKNLQKESIFSPFNDEHDIRKMNRKKVENMLELVEVQSKETPPVYKNLGRKGIVEWIWKNKVLVDIPTTFLKSYLQDKKKIDAMSFYNYYKLVLELSQQVAIFKQIPIEQVSDSDFFNEQIMHFLVENFPQTIQKKQLITSIYKKGKQALPNNLMVNILPINKTEKKEKNSTLHPRVVEFLKQMVKEGKTEGTKRNFIRHMNMFLPWLSNNMQDFKSFEPHEIPILKIKQMHVNEFRSYLLKKERLGEYAKVTVAECLYALRQFFQFLQQKYGFPNPARRLKSIKAPRYKYRDVPTDEEISTFLKTINQYSDHPAIERVAFRFMYSLGLRSIEVARLSWDDINFATKTVRIHGKGDRYDLLPLVGKLYEDLQSIERSQVTSKYLLGNNINSNLKILKNNYKLYSLIAGWKFTGGLHLFRHLFVTNLAKKGILTQAIQKLARVEKPDTVSLYTHINQKNTWLNEQINKLNYGMEED